MKHILLSILALMAIIQAYGREITGTVTDENNAPLDFVNVVLLKTDSTYVSGTVTDENGVFLFENVQDKHNIIRISSIGYADTTLNIPASGKCGLIALEPTTVLLGEVVVSAHRPATTLKGSALVTNVEGSSLAIAGTANDVLARVPMVIDNDGTLEVFGKGSPAIYINGRLVDDLQGLSQLNSQDIKNVEVITNPGAAYAADVKSVIRIRTKPPKGDGWSGAFRTDNGFLRNFRTGNTIDLKYRTGGFEVFANYGWWHGYNFTDRTDEMTTSSSAGTYFQKIHSYWKERYNDMNGKAGFSWLINENHSLGAYYRTGLNRHSMTGELPTEVWQDGNLIENISSDMDGKSSAGPLHSANFYYNGSAGKWDIDFNANYFWFRHRQDSYHNEAAEQGDDRIVTITSTNRYRMIAEKLVMSHPLWQGQIEVGEEYTNTRSTNLSSANIPEISDADNRVNESNMAVFLEIGQ